MDLAKDSVFGISTERAYQELLTGKKPVKVIVAIIDSGVDTSQEDLKPVIWTNPQDGCHGWNFIADESGREDITRLVAFQKEFYDSLSYAVVPEAYRAGYRQYRAEVPELDGKISDMKALEADLEATDKTVDTILRKIGSDNPNLDALKNYKAQNDKEREVLSRIFRRLALYSDWRSYRSAEITHIIATVKYHLAHGLNLADCEEDKEIGNADISPDKLGPVASPNATAYHGTHVAGIIAAVRNNDIGMNGIADDVQIMSLKVNGTIRELRDKSLAKALIFAVDHGAKVVNLSFGKPYTWDKQVVDNAVKYAMQHDVLLVHAAGNDGENLDRHRHFPNPNYADSSGVAQAWIEVGASGWEDDATIAAPFSNFGPSSVDVFAPGLDIYSTLPFNQYDSWSGTSMAAPVVTGLAALLREYYPSLTAGQVKYAIVNSVEKRASLKDKCSSGGIVNAYKALKLAAEMAR